MLDRRHRGERRGPRGAASAEDDEDSDSNALPIVIGVVVTLAIAGGAYRFIRTRRSGEI